MVSLEVSDFLGFGEAAEVQITATLAVKFAEIVILDVSDQLIVLTAAQVTNGGNQNALGNFLEKAISDIQKGKIDKAIDSLNQAIERTDGFVLRGSADGNGQGMDWITDEDAQRTMYALLTLAVEALE